MRILGDAHREGKIGCAMVGGGFGGKECCAGLLISLPKCVTGGMLICMGLGCALWYLSL
jgi:hypothetical protein